MRFAYVADVPWWAIARHGKGLSTYSTRHEWVVLSCVADSADFIGKVDLDLFAAVVYGCAPIADLCFRMGWVPQHGSPCLVTMTSYRDARGLTIADVETNEEADISYVFRDPRVTAIVINDRWMAPFAMPYELPVIYHPDRVDTAVFRPKQRDGRGDPEKYRVGWAGSYRHWGSVKHFELLEGALGGLTDVEFVPQRREVEGLKNRREMANWYATLDLYICANDEQTPNPVPVIEALCCGTPVATTRAGDAWLIIAGIEPGFIIDEITHDEVQRAVRYARLRNPHAPDAPYFRRVACALLGWEETGEADLFGATVEALCRG